MPWYTLSSKLENINLSDLKQYVVFDISNNVKYLVTFLRKICPY